MKIFDTERLTLRTITVDDAPFFLAMVNEPSWLQNIGDKGVRTLEQARESILSGPMAMQQKHGFSLYLTLLQGSLTPIGLCGLIKRDSLPDVDIGYALAPQFWGQGYAQEAAAALLVHAKTGLGLRRLLGITSPDNRSSCRLLEKLGMTFESIVKLTADDTGTKLYSIDF
jgi:RimJ/RimL family protein N-acetyltransferase